MRMIYHIRGGRQLWHGKGVDIFWFYGASVRNYSSNKTASDFPSKTPSITSINSGVKVNKIREVAVPEIVPRSTAG